MRNEAGRLIQTWFSVLSKNYGQHIKLHLIGTEIAHYSVINFTLSASALREKGRNVRWPHQFGAVPLYTRSLYPMGCTDQWFTFATEDLARLITKGPIY